MGRDVEAGLHASWQTSVWRTDLRTRVAGRATGQLRYLTRIMTHQQTRSQTRSFLPASSAPTTGMCKVANMLHHTGAVCVLPDLHESV